MITNNGSAGVYCQNNDTDPRITSNTITGNTRSGVHSRHSSRPILASNVITENGEHGVFCQDGSWPNIGDLANTDIEDNGGNEIHDNGGYDVRNETPNHIMAEGNFWGTTNATTIDSRIHDDEEESWRGSVDYEPFLTDGTRVMTVSVPDTTVGRGASVIVPVNIESATGLGIVAAQITLIYDASIVTATKAVTEGTIASGWSDITYNVTDGQIVIWMAGTTELVGTGALVNISFDVSATTDPGSISPLALLEMLLNEGNVPVTTVDHGVFTVAGMYGDVTDDGSVTSFDASMILRYGVGLIDLNSMQQALADVTDDGTISALDASYVLQYVVGLITSFPAEGGSAPKWASLERSIRLGRSEQWNDGWTISILIDEMDGVLAGEIELIYTGVDVREVRTVDLASEYLSAVNVADGRIQLSFAGARSSAGSGRIVEMVFDGMPVLSIDRARLNEGSIPVQIAEGGIEIPSAYRLSQNCPNPFNPETTIQYDVAQTSTVHLSVYALTGQLVRTLANAAHPAGSYTVAWDGTDSTGRDVASGVYLCRMVSGEFRASRKLLLMK